MARTRSSNDAEPRVKRSATSLATAPHAFSTSQSPITLHLADATLVLGFLGLAFLLGCFPMKDTDFWWHLRTGDLIRAGAGIPVKDWYTFGAADHLWVDLHWFFEVLLSLGYEHWGVVGLNLAKCVVTCAALLLLITSRQAGWPVWVMVLSWLPALFLLSGRMYLRPETLTLLYLAAFLAILTRWEERPRLAYLLPVVQVLWVNTQGLFVLGPIVLTFALVDAGLRPGAYATSRRSWWRTVGIVSSMTLAACVANPYGLLGALFPLQLARTMADPTFAETIGELMPVLSLSSTGPPSFIVVMGFRSLPLQFQLTTLVLGGLSFVLPILWKVSNRLRSAPEPSSRSAPPKGRRKGRKSKTTEPEHREESWRLRPFRLLLFAAFSLLSLKATRNSHQFAAVVGALTAWNFGEWAAAVRRSRSQRTGQEPPWAILPRAFTFGALVLSIAAVASGQVYAWTGEGRMIGFGEEPLWYPHEATKVAGKEGMPDRFVCFHNGHAALYEYYHGPEKKVFADARLEVIGPEVYRQYLGLERLMNSGQAGWNQELESMQRPGVLVDNVHGLNAGISATLLADPRWCCVWFDPMAAVFVHESYEPARTPVDFVRQHFQGETIEGPSTTTELLASANALYNVGFSLVTRGQTDLARPLILLGLDKARRAREHDPGAARPWKLEGLLEATLDPTGSPEEPIARFRMPFDPVFDLSAARTTYLLRQALVRDPSDGKSLLALTLAYHARGMYEAALPLDLQIARLEPPHQTLRVTERAQQVGIELAALATAELDAEPGVSWRNLDELNRVVDVLLRTGRAESAAKTLEDAYPMAARSWEVADRIATLWLHLGRPERARETWRSALGSSPRPALIAARIGATHLVEDDFSTARTAYQRALALAPDLFEALYGLAVVELDAGRAGEAAVAAPRPSRSPRMGSRPNPLDGFSNWRRLMSRCPALQPPPTSNHPGRSARLPAGKAAPTPGRVGQRSATHHVMHWWVALR